MLYMLQGFEAALSAQLAGGDQYTERITWSKVVRLLRVRSNWFFILQGLPGCLPWGMMLVRLHVCMLMT